MEGSGEGTGCRGPERHERKVQGTSQLQAVWTREWWKDGTGPGSKQESLKGFNWEKLDQTCCI